MRPRARRLDMEELLIKLFDIRPGESARALLLAADLFLIIASFYILKPVRSSVFLVSFGPGQLPYVFILIALIGGVIAAGYSSLTRRMRLNRVIIASSAAMAVILALFRLLLRVEQGWVSYGFYIFVALYGAITTSQFWLLANNLFDAREARRLFGFIATGGILGSIAGSLIDSTLGATMRVENLILVAAGLFGLSIPIVARAWRLGAGLSQMQAPAPRRSASSADSRAKSDDGPRAMVRLIRRSRHLTLLTAIIALTVIASTMVDYIFNTEAYNYFAARIGHSQVSTAPASAAAPASPGAPPATSSAPPSGAAHQNQQAIDRQVKAELTQFFGRFFGLLSVVSLVLQVGLGKRVLGGLGVITANLFLPLGLLAATGGMWAIPALFLASTARLIDGSLSYSIHRAGTELLFFPLPLAIKNRTKTFIDLFADRLARGVAGALLLVLTGVLGLHTRGLATALALVILLWLLLLERMRGEYLTAFRRAIAGRTLDVEEIREMVRSPDAIRTLADELKGDERQVLYTLTLLDTADSDLLAPHLIPLLSHPSSEVRRLAMHKLAHSGDDAHRDAVERLLDDPSREIRRDAARYLVRTAVEGADAHLRALLAAPDWRIRAAALEVIAGDALDRRDSGRLDWIDVTIIDSLLAVEGPERADASGAATRAIAALGPGTAYGARLLALLDDSDSAVRREATVAAGEVRDPRHIDRLLVGLARPSERQQARTALARYGHVILSLLGAVVDDDDADLGVRMHVPGTVGLMQSQPGADFLLARLGHPHNVIRFQVIKSLGKMRARDRDRRLTFEPPMVDARLVDETRAYFELQTHLAAWGGHDHRRRRPDPEDLVPAAGTLLKRALNERIDQNRERIFRILGLRYPDENMLFAYNGVISNQQALRAAAVEFLDNLLSPQLKRVVLPAAAEDDPRALVQRGQELFHLPNRDREGVLRQIFAGDDAWLTACAIDAAQEIGLNQFDDQIAAHRMLTVLERVKVLLQIDILAESTSEELAYLAAIAAEEQCPTGTVIFRAGEPPDAMFVVLSGRIQMVQEGGGGLKLEVGPGEAIGAWALFDDRPRTLTAVTLEDSHLLRIDREQFFDLLSDHVGITQGIFRALVRRIRALAETGV